MTDQIAGTNKGIVDQPVILTIYSKFVPRPDADRPAGDHQNPADRLGPTGGHRKNHEDDVAQVLRRPDDDYPLRGACQC